uniref:G-protein coupled receptors family 3 profile domain-containing protein n=1 Tax=Amphimedon queenslandica TaxID=400682 RepID=A0A1X7VGX3_AMPQE
MLLGQKVAGIHNKSSLTFGFITTLTGPVVVSGAIPVVDLTLKLINDRKDVLNNYTLGYSPILDSKCDRTTSLDQFFNVINSDTTIIALLGCGCSTATIPVAEISHYWNIPHIAFAASTHILNDRSRFRNFYRALISNVYFGEAVAELMVQFGWKQMGLITQDEALFQNVLVGIISAFEKQGLVLDGYIIKTGGSLNPFFARKDAMNFRINKINAYPSFSYQVLCEAYYRGMYGSKYVWILPMWYAPDWWKTVSSGNCSCTDDIMLQMLNGIMGVVPEGFFPLENESIVTYSGLTSRIFADQYHFLLQEPKYENLTELGIAGLAFDAVWAIAVGLDIASKKILFGNETGCEKLSGEIAPLEYFNYTNKKLGCILKQSFSEVNFLGITGDIAFTLNGSRLDNVILCRQYRSSGTTVNIMTFGRVTVESQRSIFKFLKGESNTSLWIGGSPPYDGYPVDRLHSNHIVLVVIYSLTAGCGIVFAVLCLTFNIVYSNKKVLMANNAKLNYLIILGSAVLYISVFFFSYTPYNPKTQEVFCNSRSRLFSLGYNLCFGVILSRTWRIYYIFSNIKAKKKVGIKNWMLLLIIIGIVLIDLIIIFTGRIKHAIVRDQEHPLVVDDNGRIVHYFVVICNSSIISELFSFGYKGILQLCAIFMAFHMRNVNVKALNESKEIAAIIYINSIVLVMLGVTEFVLDRSHNAYAALFGLGLLIDATLFLGFTFIPKIFNVYFNPHGGKLFTNTKIGKSMQSKVAPERIQDEDHCKIKNTSCSIGTLQ